MNSTCKSKHRAAFLLFVSLALASVAPAQIKNAEFYLKNGDRVVFYGDSITEQGFYTNFVESYAVTRFPDWKITFVNSGWGGDWVGGGGGGKTDERLKRDVFPHQPTVLTAMFGMNDGCYIEFNADCFKVFAEGYERLVSLLKKESPRLRITLLKPSPFDDVTGSGAWRLAPPVKSGYNPVMIRYGHFVEELARRNRLHVADVNSPLIEFIENAQKLDAARAQKIIPDRIHPGAAGGLLMAAALLKSWNAPAVVSSVEIDAADKSVVKAENSRIADLKGGESIAWRQTDAALPLPLDTGDEMTAFAVRLSNVNESLNRQTLVVRNLRAARYRLKIDGENVAAFSRAELARGVNLAVLPTPMLKQALEIHRLTERRHKLRLARWREVQVPLANEDLPSVSQAIKALADAEAELTDKRRIVAQPRPHLFELIPQSE